MSVPPPAARRPFVGSLLWLLDETNIVVTSTSFVWLVAAPSALKVWFLGGAVGAMLTGSSPALSHRCFLSSPWLTSHSLANPTPLSPARPAKVLKHVIHEARPTTHRPSSTSARLLSSTPLAALPTYGMPSTHSTTISFYSASALLYLFPTQPVWAVGAAFFGALVAWSRVELGHHSWPQVGAGVLLGAVLAVGQWTCWVGLGSWEGLSPRGEGLWALGEHVLRRVRAAM